MVGTDYVHALPFHLMLRLKDKLQLTAGLWVTQRSWR